MPKGDQQLEACPLGALLLSWACLSSFESQGLYNYKPAVKGWTAGLQLTPGPSPYSGVQGGNELIRLPCLGLPPQLLTSPSSPYSQLHVFAPLHPTPPHHTPLTTFKYLSCTLGPQAEIAVT